MPIKSYAAMNPKEKLQLFSYEPKPLSPHEIEVTITHSGVCHTDLNLIDNDWGISQYPLVPGHEIIGRVSAVGSAVKHLAINQRVGVGWRNGSCWHCKFCADGEENLCLEEKIICVDHFGGFAEKVIADSRFAFPIPDQLSSAHAAPLLCAGITVYAPLARYIKPGMKVGIIGIGGLGHLALQFAHKMGAEVTAFSTSKNKEAEARAFGAKHFILSTDKNNLQKMANSLDFILSTVYVDLNIADYLNLLAPKGIFCFVGVQQEDIKFPGIALMLGNKTICSSTIGGSREMHAMLEFCAKQNIQPQIEIFPMRDINIALDKVRNNNVRYRAVLEC